MMVILKRQIKTNNYENNFKNMALQVLFDDIHLDILALYE
jgi:hypothetical protein